MWRKNNGKRKVSLELSIATVKFRKKTSKRPSLACIHPETLWYVHRIRGNNKSSSTAGATPGRRQETVWSGAGRALFCRHLFAALVTFSRGADLVRNPTLAPASTRETRERERSGDDVELAAGADIEHERWSWGERRRSSAIQGNRGGLSFIKPAFIWRGLHRHRYTFMHPKHSVAETSTQNAITSSYLQAYWKWRYSVE